MTVRHLWHYFGFVLKFIFFLPISSSAEASYNIHWLEGSKIELYTQSLNSPLNIYCYKGRSKYLLDLWHSVVIYIDLKNDKFSQYIGHTPEEVWEAYKSDNSQWTLNIFTSRKSRYIQLNPFNQTCFAINTDQSHTIRLQIENVDYMRTTLFVCGVVLFLWARVFSENSLFYYTTGISIGIGFSFMLLVYIFSKMLPGKPVMYGTMIGGWAVGAYFFNFLWSNFQPLLVAYRQYFMWYIFIVGFISFIICYIRGPPRDRRSKNIITWTLQIIGLFAIYYSSDVFEAIVAICVILIIFKYMPFSWLSSIRKYWIRRYPPKRRLLTEEEFHEEGIRETAKALESLRGYCSSPECKQWELVRKLKNPSKFASFIEDGEHVDDDEVNDYDNSDFVIRRPKYKNSMATPVDQKLGEDDFTSDDSSLSPDEM